MGNKNKRKLFKKPHLHKPHLIPEWKLAWRFWSMRFAALGTLLTSILIVWPEAALMAWNMLPQDLKSAVPEKYTPLIGVGIFMLSMFARVIQQTKLQPQQSVQQTSMENTDGQA